MNANLPPKDETEQALQDTVNEVARRAALSGVALGSKALAATTLEHFAQNISAAHDYESLMQATNALLRYLRRVALSTTTQPETVTPEEPNAEQP